MRLNKIQQAAVTALEDIKATDIVTLDTRTLTSLYDAVVIATAESPRQTKALARNVQDKVRAAGGSVRAIEGEGSGEWVLVDCGELIAHIMLPQTRTLYNLEELWTPSASSTGTRTRKPANKTGALSTVAALGSRGLAGKVGTSSAAASAPAPVKRSAKPVTVAVSESDAPKPAAKRRTTSTASTASTTTKRTAAKKPAAKRPAAKKPASSKAPSSKKVAAKKPAAKTPSTKRAAVKKPAAKKSAARKPATKRKA